MRRPAGRATLPPMSVTGGAAHTKGRAEGGDGKRRVFLDIDETGSGWLFVVVAAPTGVIYQTQGGGYGCIPYEQEGYLLPFYVPGADAGLNDLFVGALRSCGSRRLDWPPNLLDRLRREVADLHIWGSANQDDVSPTLWPSTSPASPRPTKHGCPF